MYINDLGYGRTDSVGSRTRAARTAEVIGRRNSDSYQTVMKKAVDNQKTVTAPTFASAGDVIIKEAFEKMKTDPEWEESVMNKVKEYYDGNYTVGADKLPELGGTEQSAELYAAEPDWRAERSGHGPDRIFALRLWKSGGIRLRDYDEQCIEQQPVWQLAAVGFGWSLHFAGGLL